MERRLPRLRLFLTAAAAGLRHIPDSRRNYLAARARIALKDFCGLRVSMRGMLRFDPPGFEIAVVNLPG